MWLLGSIFIFTSLLILYIKYRVVFTGEKCKGKIIDIVEQNAGYVVWKWGFQMLWFSYRDCCFGSIFIWRFYDLLSLMIKPSRFQFEKKLYAKKNLEVMEETIWKI